MMKKKMIVASMIAAVTLFTAPVQASEQSAIDYDSMSVEDLIALRDEINSKIAEKGGDNIITKGDYEVGVDIRAGSFKVFCSGDDCVNFYIYDSKEDLENYESSQQVLVYNDDTAGGMLNLKEGQIVSISTGAAIIEEITNASWMPDKE